MPLSGQTPLTTITVAKELPASYQPLLLVELQFQDGTYLRLASENLDSTLGGIQYNGFDWWPRLQAQSLAGISSMSNNGIVVAPQITLTIIDADKRVLNATERTNGRGFKGALCTVYLVMADLADGAFSSDYRVVFIGRCDPMASWDAETITVTAINKLSLGQRFLPTAKISRNCIHVFPSTAEQRARAADDPDSPWWGCGYSPDSTSANARGNGLFTDCPRNVGACVERMGNAGLPSANANPNWLEVDEAGRPTGRFSGIFWNPPLDWRGVAFTTGEQGKGLNNYNDTKIGDYFPLLYGKCMVQPPVMNVIGDPNSTRFEVVLSYGRLTEFSQANQGGPAPIDAVLVNDVVVPHASQTSDLIFRWYWITSGDRTGFSDHTPVFDGANQPYGSECCILIIVPKDVAESSSLPNVRVLTGGNWVKVYHSTDPTDYTKTAASMNFVWNTLDLLAKCNLTATDDIDLATFIAEAPYASAMINYRALDGTTKQHERFRCGVAYRNPRKADDVLTSLLMSFRGILRTSLTDGRIQLLIEKTLGDQQPSPMPGSNAPDAVPSVDASGAGKDGYLAYDFNETNILLEETGSGVRPTLRFTQRATSDTPNTITVSFMDEDASFVSDTLTLTDSDDVFRTSRQINSNISPDGILNYDQAFRITQLQFAKQFRGNPRAPVTGSFDTGGTWIAEWTTTAKCVDVRCGDIVGVAFGLYGLARTTFRVISIEPQANWETCKITAHLHKDEWYLDSYGQINVVTPTLPPSSTIQRPPFGWCPNEVAPTSADAFAVPTDLQFAISQNHAPANDGTLGTLIQINGKSPVNKFSPSVGIPVVTQATEAAGGAVPEGTWWMGVAATDGAGLESPIQRIEPWATVPAGATGSLTLGPVLFTPGGAGSKLFGGKNPNRLCLQGTNTLVMGGLPNVATEGAPDPVFQTLKAAISRATLGVWTYPIDSATTGSVTILNANMTAGQFAGAVLSVHGKASDGASVPFANFPVSGNSATSVSIGAGSLSLGPGDVVSVRAMATIASPNTIGDPNFVNPLPDVYHPLSISRATLTAPIQITTTTPHGITTGAEVVIANLDNFPSALGRWSVTVIDTYTLSLTTNVLTGLASKALTSDVYDGGGLVYLTGQGLKTDGEKGRSVRIVAGTGAGQRRTIQSNTQTTLTVDRNWDTIPDATSVFILVDGTPFVTASTDPVTNSDPTTPIQVQAKLGTIPQAGLFVEGYTVSASGVQALAKDTPCREIWVHPVLPRLVQPPQNIVLESDPSTATGPGAPRILVTWSLPNDPTVTTGGHVEAQYKEVGAATWTDLANVDAGSPQSFYISGVVEQHSYLVNLRVINSAGATSNWVQTGPVIALSEYAGNDGENEIPSGTRDGNNTIFTLAHSPKPNSLRLFENGILLLLNVDYTLSGNTITLIGRNAGEYPDQTNGNGDSLRAWYSY